MRVALRPLGGGTRTEEAVEDELGVHFLGLRLGGRAPGHRGGVNAGVAGVAVARHRTGLRADLKGGQTRLVREPRGGDLVHGDARADVGAVRLARLAAGEEGSERTGVVAAAVAVGAGLVRREAGEDGEIAAIRRDGLKDRGQLGGQIALGLRRPVHHVLAVGDVEEGHAVGRGLAGGGVAGGPARHRPHRFEPREREGRAETFECGAAGERGDFHVHNFVGVLARPPADTSCRAAS